MPIPASTKSKRVTKAWSSPPSEGITNGAMAGLLISRLILDGRSDWTSVYEPSRKPLSATATFLEENATMVKNLSEHVRPGDVASVDELKPGEGGIVRSGLKKIA